MEPMVYTGEFRIDRLVPALEAVPGLEPTIGPNGQKQAMFTLEHAGGRVVITPAETATVNPADVDAVMLAHDPSPDPEPDYGDDAARLDRAQVVQIVSQFRGFLGLATPSEAQKTAVLKLLIRVALAFIQRFL